MGFGENDAINRLIINPGDHSTELNNPGMFYVAASRGKTFGKPTAEQPYPRNVGSKRNGGGRFTGIQNNAVARSTI